MGYLQGTTVTIISNHSNRTGDTADMGYLQGNRSNHY